jgi:hypothetical protein
MSHPMSQTTSQTTMEIPVVEVQRLGVGAIHVSGTWQFEWNEQDPAWAFESYYEQNRYGPGTQRDFFQRRIECDMYWYCLGAVLDELVTGSHTLTKRLMEGVEDDLTRSGFAIKVRTCSLVIDIDRSRKSEGANVPRRYRSNN